MIVVWAELRRGGGGGGGWWVTVIRELIDDNSNNGAPVHGHLQNKPEDKQSNVVGRATKWRNIHYQLSK